MAKPAAPAKPAPATKSAAPPAERPHRARRRYIYAFGAGRAEGDASMRDLLGGKGAGLAEMTNAGLPVPPGFPVGFPSAAGVDDDAERPLRRIGLPTLPRLGPADHLGRRHGTDLGRSAQPAHVAALGEIGMERATHPLRIGVVPPEEVVLDHACDVGHRREIGDARSDGLVHDHDLPPFLRRAHAIVLGHRSATRAGAETRVQF